MIKGKAKLLVHKLNMFQIMLVVGKQKNLVQVCLLEITITAMVLHIARMKRFFLGKFWNMS